MSLFGRSLRQFAGVHYARYEVVVHTVLVVRPAYRLAAEGAALQAHSVLAVAAGAAEKWAPAESSVVPQAYGAQRGQAGGLGLAPRFRLLFVAPSGFGGSLVVTSKGPRDLVATEAAPASVPGAPSLLVQIEARAETAAEAGHLQRDLLEWAA